MARTRLRSLLSLGLFALAIACGDDDGTGDAGTSAASTAGTTAADGTTEASEAEVTGPPLECEAAMCGDGEFCVVPGDCTSAPSCAPAEMILCDFATGTCTLQDVCSGPLQVGALVCETCL